MERQKKNVMCETAQWFPYSQQEAHRMVREANVKQAGAEKQLKEAQGKVCDGLTRLTVVWEAQRQAQ